MIFWRISRHLELNGIGGLRTRGRWHDVGQPVVYFSESPSAALLEICAHTTASDVPRDFTLLRIEGPTKSIATVTNADLPENWIRDIVGTRERGTNWLKSNAGVLLRVPSAIVPHTVNFLFNPLHPDASSFRIVEAVSYPFDVRIKQ